MDAKKVDTFDDSTTENDEKTITMHGNLVDNNVHDDKQSVSTITISTENI